MKLHFLPQFIQKALNGCHLTRTLGYHQIANEDYKNISGWEMIARDDLAKCNYRIIIQPLVPMKKEVPETKVKSDLMFSDFIKEANHGNG